MGTPLLEDTPPPRAITPPPTNKPSRLVSSGVPTLRRPHPHPHTIPSHRSSPSLSQLFACCAMYVWRSIEPNRQQEDACCIIVHRSSTTVVVVVVPACCCCCCSRRSRTACEYVRQVAFLFPPSLSSYTLPRGACTHTKYYIAVVHRHTPASRRSSSLLFLACTRALETKQLMKIFPHRACVESRWSVSTLL